MKEMNKILFLKYTEEFLLKVTLSSLIYEGWF